MKDAPAERGLLRLEKHADAMGSTCSIVLYGGDERKMEAAIGAAFRELRRIDRKFSIYHAGSEWSEINRKAARQATGVSPETFQFLCACLEYSRQSEGAFDISVGPLLKLWGFFRGTGRVPTRAETSAALAGVGFRHIRLDREARTVRFERPGMEIDPGGIGKGYALDRMVNALRERGFDKALATASGSSIYGMGSPPGSEEGWPIDIRDPLNPGKTAAGVFLKDLSISTSGSFEKAFRVGGETCSHIMDPRIGRPVQGMRQVSVVAPRAMDSEAWTKPCIIHGRRWAASHMPRELRAFFCGGTGGRPHAWLGESH